MCVAFLSLKNSLKYLSVYLTEKFERWKVL